METIINNMDSYLAQGYTTVSISGFIINFIVAALLSYSVKLIFIKYGKTMSNRETFSNNFIPLSLTTMIIITIVKSSLALSLGLVGALSIVRFRTAIKEPEELLFLFICITIGLGFGANQPIITILGILMLIIIFVFFRRNQSKSDVSEAMIMRIISKDKNIELKNIFEILKKESDEIDLKLVEESSNFNEVSFIIKVHSIENLINLKNQIRNFDEKLEVKIINNTNFF